MPAQPFRSVLALGLISLCSLTLEALPASATSPVKPPTTNETQAVRQFLRNSQRFKVCADSLDMTTAQRASRAYRVNDQTYFVVVQCFLAAYQGNYEFFLYSPNAKGSQVKRLTITEFTEGPKGKPSRVESPSIGGLPTFDPKQRILTVQTKYRGVGDCGSTGRYRLENNALKVLNFQAKFACDGKMAPYTQIFPQ